MKRVLMLILTPALIVFTATASAQSGYPGEVLNDRFSIKTRDSVAYVFIIGEIRNNSGAALEDIVVEARFFDADGELTDVIVERLYSIDVPPAETVAFRMQELAVGEPEDYASHQARLVSANQVRPCTQSPGGGSNPNFELIKKLLVSSFPILLLLAAWIYFMRRASGKNSPQQRSLDLIDKQNEMIEKQSSAIERIADTLEADKGSRR